MVNKLTINRNKTQINELYHKNSSLNPDSGLLNFQPNSELHESFSRKSE